MDLASELADVVIYIESMEMEADPEDLAELEAWIMEAEDKVLNDEKFWEFDDALVAFEDKFGSDLEEVLFVLADVE